MVAVDLLTICSSRVGAFLRGGGLFRGEGLANSRIYGMQFSFFVS